MGTLKNRRRNVMRLAIKVRDNLGVILRKALFKTMAWILPLNCQSILYGFHVRTMAMMQGTTCPNSHSE